MRAREEANTEKKILKKTQNNKKQKSQDKNKNKLGEGENAARTRRMNTKKANAR